MKKTIQRLDNDNKKQKDSLFFYEGDTPMTINVELDNGEKYELVAVVHGTKEILKNEERINSDISTEYDDNSLYKDISNGIIKVIYNNWFEISIFHNDIEYETEETFHSLETLENYTDQEILELIQETMQETE